MNEPIIEVTYKRGDWCSCHGKRSREQKIATFKIGSIDPAQRQNYTVGFDLCHVGVLILRRKTSGFSSRQVGS
jgi:hypothetical protein